MKVDVTTIFFNSIIPEATATAPWCVSIGQGREKKINSSIDGLQDILNGLIYKAIKNHNLVDLSAGSKNNEYLLISIFDKVYVNGSLIDNLKIIVTLVREHTKSHEGRLRISLPPYATFKEDDIVFSNEKSYQTISSFLGCGDIYNGGCWFVDDISVVNQDELHFSCVVVNKYERMSYQTSQIRSANWQSLVPKEHSNHIFAHHASNDDFSLHQIFFGAPGTGKSHTINSDANITEQNSIRTTFHPDSDYSTFVGCYKPTKDEESGEITYDFTPQAFTNAYVAAWKDLDNPFYLIIEEINRGNCAQIFGDIFQLLDRNEQGYSSYKTTPDQDLANYIRKQLADTGIEDAEVKSGKKMQLPPNLHIWATMNTSDQSLFPIDSAFKRRWDWRYIPIDYTDRGHYIACGDTQYSWADFLQKVNDKVEAVTQSEDKKLGYWFMGNGAEQKEITIDRFVSKVVFYLWNDVFKDFGKSGNTIFKEIFDKFHKFFDFGGNPKEDVVGAFLDALEVKNGEMEAGDPEAGTSSNGIDYTKYSFNGENKLTKKALGEKIVLKYLEQNPNLTFTQIESIFAFDDSVVSKEQYKGIIAKSEDVTGSYVPSYSTEHTSIDGVKYKILTWWNKYNINFIIKFAESQGWSVTEEQK